MDRFGLTEVEWRDRLGKLETAAALLRAGRISRDEWFRRADAVLSTIGPRRHERLTDR